MTEKLCQCGCLNSVTKKSNKYIRGHNRKNKKISNEHKQKLLNSNIGRQKTQEEKIKISKSIKRIYNDPESIYNKNKKEISEKQSESQINAWKKDTHKAKTKECKKRQKDINLKNRKLGIYDTVEYKNKVSKKHKELWNDPNSAYNSKERSNKISKSMKKLFLDENYLKKYRKGLKTAPNKSENKIIKILKTIDYHRFEFVGDFSIWIGGKNPDFLDKRNNKIIEMFGDYWHSEKMTGLTKNKHENKRKDHFIKFGYSTLIIWEHELKNIDRLTNKILNFLEV